MNAPYHLKTVVYLIAGAAGWSLGMWYPNGWYSAGDVITSALMGVSTVIFATGLSRLLRKAPDRPGPLA